MLDIDGARSFGYESMYFDTPELRCYFGAAHRRPTRFKLRTRTYLDNAICNVEVKMRDRRGNTIKHRQDHDIARRGELTASARHFVAHFDGLGEFALSARPVLTTTYRRSTLLVGDSRATIDSALCCGDASGSVEIVGHVIVETKSSGAPSAMDHALWANHVRQVRISKYGTGLAALHEHLPANIWHRTLRHFSAG